MKANPHPSILSALSAIGAGFDVASRGEIEAALAAGADPVEDLIFAEPIFLPRNLGELMRLAFFVPISCC